MARTLYSSLKVAEEDLFFRLDHNFKTLLSEKTEKEFQPRKEAFAVDDADIVEDEDVLLQERGRRIVPKNLSNVETK